MANLASLTKIYKEMTKTGILTNGDYNKNRKLGNNSFKVCQNSNEMTNEAVDNCEVYENDKFGKNL